jgi:hypothetical protein
MTNEERSNILDQHKEVYDGYVTSYAQPEKEQPLYTQSYANDKGGINVNNRGEVSTYSNLRINEMRHDGKSTGLFQDEEPVEEDYMSPGAQFDTTESFESEDKDDEYYVSLGEQLDMIGDGDDDLEHGVFGHDDESDMVLVSPEVDFDDEDEFMDYDGDDASTWPGANYGDEDDDEEELNFELNIDDLMNLNNNEDDIDQDEVEGLFDDLKESLDMFKRFTKYN